MLTLSPQEIINGAIRREEESLSAYRFAATKVMSPDLKATLEVMAQEELGRIEKLKKLEPGCLEVPHLEGIENTKILDFLEGGESMGISSFQDVLLFAMKQEQLALEAYGHLSRLIDEPRAKGLFEFLALEGLAHKRTVEALYDELVYLEE
jgi:rubrerythrin